MLFGWSQVVSISHGGQSGTTGRTGVEGRLWEREGPRMTHTSCWNLCYHPSASGGEKTSNTAPPNTVQSVKKQPGEASQTPGPAGLNPIHHSLEFFFL